MTSPTTDAGYRSKAYADSLAELGEPVRLEGSGGWALARDIPTGAGRDAMGTYPLFSATDLSRLWDDLDTLPAEVVAFSAVIDPLSADEDGGAARLGTRPWDVLKPFKEHFVVRLRQQPLDDVSSHHRRYARKALRELEVQRSLDPSAELEDWVRLYGALIERHSIDGIAEFSRSSFEQQLRVPGLEVFRAVADGQVVGMVLWFRQGDHVYYHLGAYSETGYRLRASMGIFWRAIEYFAETGGRLMNLGGGAGLSVADDDGLARFKRGWAGASRTAHFVGRILDRARYDALVAEVDPDPADFFPGYRAPRRS